MPKTHTDYSNTIIYKLCCKNPDITDIYVGHTTNFTQRKNQHKNSRINENNKKYKQYVYEFIRQHGGWENWSMVQIEEVFCKDKRQAETVEQNWIEQTAAKLNSNNPYALCTEQPKIYKHNWYEENKEHILQKAKQHYEENKEHKIEYQTQYAQEHKEHISEYQKQYREQNKEKLTEQKKIYRETNKEISKLKQKEWREANKEKIKAQKSQVIQCECGQTYTFGNKIRHLRSKNHLENIGLSC